MHKIAQENLRRLLAEDGVQEAVEEVKRDLTRSAVSKNSSAEERDEYCHMLWALDALMVKIQSHIEQGDQADE